MINFVIHQSGQNFKVFVILNYLYFLFQLPLVWMLIYE